jgi:hypothetical protein
VKDTQDLGAIVAELKTKLDPILADIEAAEDEIEAAKRRHPELEAKLHRSFILLKPTSEPLTTSPLVYRSHCRELLDRVAAGEDTRPGTAAECCIALSEASLAGPLSTASAGLYARMWKLADLPQTVLSDAGVHYEALEGAAIDEQEAWLRKKLSQGWRTPEGQKT